MVLIERCCVRMKTEYKHYTEITKEILDSIKAGMLVKINDWKRPMKVVGVSENYFCMIQRFVERFAILFVRKSLGVE